MAPLVLGIILILPNEANANPILIDNSDGIRLNDRLFTENFFPYDFIYNFDTKFYLKDGTYLGQMMHIAEDAHLRRYGRTFAHPSTYYRWGEAFGGNAAYVRDNVAQTSLFKKSNASTVIRAHSGDLGYSSGAIITPMFAPDGGGLTHVVVEQTPFPSGTFSNPAKANTSEDFELNLNAREYNPYTSFVRYEVWVNSFYKVAEGSIDKDSVTNHKIKLNFTTSGTRQITVRLFDSVERRTNINGSIYINTPPVADFISSPTTIYNNTTVNFTNRSSDADGDALTYQWAYQEPGSTVWTNFSTALNPSRIFTKKGTWQIRLTVNDGTTASTVTKPLVVGNRIPTTQLTYSPGTIYEGDTVTLSATPNDLDNDSMTVIFEELVGTSWTARKQVDNVNNGTVVKHAYQASPNSYRWRVRVIDTSGGTAIASINFVANALKIVGSVSHTPDWEDIHNELEHEPDQFYSGETFITQAVVTNHLIESVTVSFSGKQVNGNTLSLNKVMIANPHPTYLAEVFDNSMVGNQTKLDNGIVHFVFTARWKNGVIKQSVVSVNIVDDIYKAFEMNRTN